MIETGGYSVCELCGREVEELTRHHLIPQTRHNNRKNKREFSRTEVKERIALLCRPCHKTVHATLDNKTLEQQYNTLESIAAHPDIQRFVTWIRKKPELAVLRVRKQKRKGI